MAQQPFISAPDIDLSGPPWNVTKYQSVYVLYADKSLKLYTDDDCQQEHLFNPADFYVKKKVPTGLYFFIASGSETGTEFPDPISKSPVTWKDDEPQPATVTLGKYRQDGKAFSLKDYWDHPNEVKHEFTINVREPGGGLTSTSIIEGVNPTIVERGEEPPGG